MLPAAWVRALRALLIAALLLGSGALVPPVRASAGPVARPGEVIVVPQPGAVATAMAQDLPERNGEIGAVAVGVSGRVLLLRVPVGREREYRDRLATDPGVAAVALNYEVAVEAAPAPVVPDDPRYDEQWGLAAVRAPEAWATGARGAGVTVAVIDTGADYDHPDLAGALLPGCSFLAVPPTCDPTAADDDHGHGTHVAGTIAARTDNGIGVAGLAWGASILPLKALDAHGVGSWFAIADAIAYATDQPGVRVINLSLGSPPFFPPDSRDLALLRGAIDEARGRGITVVAAAGNNGVSLDIAPVYPAALPGVIAVTAVDREGNKPGWANFGSAVAVAAPGVDILAPSCAYQAVNGPCTPTYTARSGTSMATPHVAALASLLVAQTPSLTPDGVAQVIRQSAIDLGAAGADTLTGAGRIDAVGALGMPSPPPLALVASGPGAVRSAFVAGQGPGGGVALTAVPHPGALFLGWQIAGMPHGWANPLVLTPALGQTVVATFASRPTFADVPPDLAAAEAIAQLAARGIVNGYGDGRFGPTDGAQRAQVAALIVRAVGWSGEQGSTPFSDRGGTDPELWRAVGILAERGVAQGYADGSFHPSDPILQAQVVSFVTRALVASGHWTLAADDPALSPNVPASSGHRRDLATFVRYAGAIPGMTADGVWDSWAKPASREWLALVIWQALEAAQG